MNPANPWRFLSEAQPATTAKSHLALWYKLKELSVSEPKTVQFNLKKTSIQTSKEKTDFKY